MARILLVADHPDTCEALSRFLQTGGHYVRCVPNGKEALAEVLNVVPDVVLLDLVMPEMDGPSFLEVVRSYLRLQSLPVVILTAFTDSPMLECRPQLERHYDSGEGQGNFRGHPKGALRKQLSASPAETKKPRECATLRGNAWLSVPLIQEGQTHEHRLCLGALSGIA